MSKITYKIKKGKEEGDFEITKCGMEVTFSIKEKLMNFTGMQRLMKEIAGTINVIKAEMKNLETHHKKAFTMFSKLSEQEKIALKMWILNEERLKEEEVKNKQFSTDFKNFEKELKEIHKQIEKSPLAKKTAKSMKK
jgi:hypothetical protein